MDTKSGISLGLDSLGSAHPYLPVLVSGFTFFTGTVLLISGLGHLSNTHAFLDTVYRYQILPYSLVPLIASFLPALTVVVGVALVFGKMLRGSLWISAGLFSGFAGAQAVQLLSTGASIECGCFVWFPHQTSFFNVVCLLLLSSISVACSLAVDRTTPKE